MPVPSALPKSNRSRIDDHVTAELTKRIEDGFVFENVISLTTANGGGTSYGLFITGIEGVVIYLRSITTNVNEMVYQPFRNSTVTNNGVDITAQTVSINGLNQKDSTVSLYQGSTVTVDGDPIPRTYIPGEPDVGNVVSGGFNDEGFVRILQPNSTYAVKMTNNGGKANATTDIHLVWFEFINNVTWR